MKKKYLPRTAAMLAGGLKMPDQNIGDQKDEIFSSSL